MHMLQVAEVATSFDDDGILMRFMNSPTEGNGLRLAMWRLQRAGCSWHTCIRLFFLPIDESGLVHTADQVHFGMLLMILCSSCTAGPRLM
jgi:hypothetical protein